VPEFHAEAPRATVSEGLAQGPYVAARARVEHMTLRTKGIDSTNAPPRPINVLKAPQPKSVPSLADRMVLKNREQGRLRYQNAVPLVPTRGADICKASRLSSNS